MSLLYSATPGGGVLPSSSLAHHWMLCRGCKTPTRVQWNLLNAVTWLHQLRSKLINMPTAHHGSNLSENEDLLNSSFSYLSFPSNQNLKIFYFLLSNYTSFPWFLLTPPCALLILMVFSNQPIRDETKPDENGFSPDCLKTSNTKD